VISVFETLGPLRPGALGRLPTLPTLKASSGRQSLSIKLGIVISVYYLPATLLAIEWANEKM